MEQHQGLVPGSNWEQLFTWAMSALPAKKPVLHLISNYKEDLHLLSLGFCSHSRFMLHIVVELVFIGLRWTMQHQDRLISSPQAALPVEHPSTCPTAVGLVMCWDSRVAWHIALVTCHTPAIPTQSPEVLPNTSIPTCNRLCFTNIPYSHSRAASSPFHWVFSPSTYWCSLILTHLLCVCQSCKHSLSLLSNCPSFIPSATLWVQLRLDLKTALCSCTDILCTPICIFPQPCLLIESKGIK